MPDPKKGDLGRSRGAVIRRRPRFPWVLWLIFIGLGAGLITGGFFVYGGFSTQLERSAQDQLQAIADLKVNQIVQWRQERIEDGQVLAENPLTALAVEQWRNNPEDTRAKEAVRQWMSANLQHFDYQSMVLLDPQGNLLLAEPAEERGNVDSTRSLAASALANRKAILSDLYQQEGSGRILLDLVIPLYSVGPLLNATGQDPLAVLVIRIDPDKFLYPLIQSWPTPSPSGETLLVRKEGEAVVYLNELRHRQGTALVLRIPIGDGTLLAAKAVLGQTGFFEGIDYRGIPALGVVRPIPDSTWFIVAKVDRAEIFAPLSQSGWLLFGLVAALILAAGGAIGFFWRRQQIQVYRRQVQIGQERLAAQRLFNQFFNMSLDPLCIAGLDGYFKQLNPAFASTLGFSRDELLSKPFLEFVHPEDRPAMLAATEQLSTGQALTRFANRYACKDGSYRWLSWTIHPDPQEQLLYAVAHDITENRQAEEVIRKLNAELEQRVRERTAELEDAVKELETFSYSVSHDLRSPLRAIDGFSRLLLTTTAGHLDGEQERLLQVIRSSTQQMGQLIADLLAFARLGRQELRKSKVDMEKLAHSVFAELRTANSGRPLELVMDSIPPALGDPSMLRQVWFNLLSNAVKFTRGRDPARIEIGSQTEDGMNRYSVKDNGVGFDMHYADKLFGVFQRLHSTREFEGTGVGLAIVQRVIHRLGGKVQADGTVGAGATFAFTLPKGE